MRTIAVINAKGGCGKSAIAVNVAAALGERGLRTLLVDLDPQGSASDWLGAGPTGERDLFDAFVGTRELATLAAPSRAPLVDLVAASSWLVTAERTLQVDLAIGAIRAMERLPEEWDVVLVDCPPTLGYLATAALCGVPLGADVCVTSCRHLATYCERKGRRRPIGAARAGTGLAT